MIISDSVMPHSKFFSEKLREKIKKKEKEGPTRDSDSKLFSPHRKKMDLHHIETGKPKAFNPRKKKSPTRLGFDKITSIYGNSYPNAYAISKLETWFNLAMQNSELRMKQAKYEDYSSISELVHNEDLNVSYADDDTASAKQKDNLVGFTQAVISGNSASTKARNKHFVYTLHDDKDKAVGLVHFIMKPDRHCELLTLSVSPHYQNKGLGSLLISKVIMESLKNNCSEISDNYSVEAHSVAQLSKFGFAPDDEGSSINVRTDKVKKILNQWLNKPIEEKMSLIHNETPEQVTLFLEHTKSQRFFFERIHYLAHGKFHTSQLFPSEKDMEARDEDTDKYLIDERDIDWNLDNEDIHRDFEIIRRNVVAVKESGILNLARAEDKKMDALFDHFNKKLFHMQACLEGSSSEHISSVFSDLRSTLKEIEVLQRGIQENDESPYMEILTHLMEIQSHLDQLEENVSRNPGTVATGKFVR